MLEKDEIIQTTKAIYKSLRRERKEKEEVKEGQTRNNLQTVRSKVYCQIDGAGHFRLDHYAKLRACRWAGDVI